MTSQLLAAEQSGSSIGSLLVFLVLGLLFYLFAVLPSRRRLRAMRQVQGALAPGREVMTGSGIYGRVVDIDPVADTVTLEIAPGVATRFARAAVVRLVDETAAVAAEPGAAEG